MGSAGGPPASCFIASRAASRPELSSAMYGPPATPMPISLPNAENTGTAEAFKIAVSASSLSCGTPAPSTSTWVYSTAASGGSAATRRVISSSDRPPYDTKRTESGRPGDASKNQRCQACSRVESPITSAMVRRSGRNPSMLPKMRGMSMFVAAIASPGRIRSRCAKRASTAASSIGTPGNSASRYWNRNVAAMPPTPTIRSGRGSE